jgi:hypothetical protein
MPEPQSALTEQRPERPLAERPCSQLPQQGTVTLDGKRYQVQLVNPQIIQHHIDHRPTHYQTAKSRGISSPPVNLPKPPSILALTLATVIALSFLVAASMFSISLTAYSNSVDRVDETRSFIRVE